MTTRRLFVLMSCFTIVAAPAAAQRPADTVYKSSDGVTLPVPLRRVKALHPTSAQQARIQGTVIVSCVVLPDGTVGDVRVTKPLSPALDDEAVRAVRQWRFRPGTKDGQAVSVDVSIETSFALRGPTYEPGDGVSLPVPIKQVAARYPEAERAAGIQGTVTVQCVVLPDGTVGDTNAVASADPALDEEAIQAVKQWQFKPGMRNGEAVPVRVSVEISFRLG